MRTKKRKGGSFFQAASMRWKVTSVRSRASNKQTNKETNKQRNNRIDRAVRSDRPSLSVCREMSIVFEYFSEAVLDD